MAIYHLSVKPVARGSGRSAVAAAAYRSATRIENQRDGLVHDFRAKGGVDHAEIVIPEGVSADWAKNRAALWNAAEFAETRKDGRVAREFEIALPHELSSHQRIALARDFAQGLADRYGTAVDFAVHQPHVEGDIRNHHAHVLMTTRTVGSEGLGSKTYIERANKDLLPEGLPTSQMQIRDIRQSFEHMANTHLARAGLDILIDHRSHLERGLEIEPTGHVGVHATQIERENGAVSRTRLDEEAARRNAELIREKPEQVLTLITGEKSVFDRNDIARTLHRYINDDAQAYQNTFAKVMTSPALVELQSERIDTATGEIQRARYSTADMVAIESGMANSAERLHQARTHEVDHRHVARAIGRQDDAIRSSVASDSAFKVERGELNASERNRRVGAARLSDEQRAAIKYITGPERITAVVGYAGAGKSTMLAAAREAWEAQGCKVHGAALSGKAAEGLEEASGIQSRTLASWEYRWAAERDQLGRGDVFVIDEAGMIGSRQMARFVSEVETSGAKLVLVGDHEQLQAIGAGAPFRAIAEQVGHAELSEIRRQRVDWQREAAVAFATHRTGEGLAAYRDRGNIRFSVTRDGARAEIVRDYLSDRDERPGGSRVAMAHRRADVRAINDAVRSTLQERCDLARGEDAGELTFQTIDGKRSFAPGDRVVFLQNDRDLGVKNGMLGTVYTVEPDALQVRLDQKTGGAEDARDVTVRMRDYQAVDHGYATTIHKNQGATVDRAFVMASATMDRHLTYVAMTRHRDGVALYAAQDEFTNRKPGQRSAPGRLVEHGTAPYGHRPGNRGSYFVTLENAQGERHTTWGVDLERAMAETRPEIGAKIGLEHTGSETVRLPNGATTERNAWKVHRADELAFTRLEERLSRSGVKETTLDYARDFAVRRGVGAQFGVRSSIDVDPAQKLTQEAGSRAVHPVREVQDRSIGERSAYGACAPSRTDPDLQNGKVGADQRRAQQTEPPKRSMFAGLKLKRAQEQIQTEGGQLERGPLESREVPRPAQDSERLVERLRRPSGFEQSIDRFARAWIAIEKMDRRGLPVLEGQKSELRRASQELDRQRPGASRLMVSAIQYDPETDRAMHELSGQKRVGHLAAGIQREWANHADPTVRADRLIERLQALQEERQGLGDLQHHEARAKVEGQMRQVASTIGQDPQVESIVRSRSKEIGISHVRRELAIADAMEHQLSRGMRLER